MAESLIKTLLNPTMTREEVYQDMERMFGLVPSFFRLVPDRSLCRQGSDRGHG